MSGIKFHDNCAKYPDELRSKVINLLPDEFATIVISIREYPPNGLNCIARLSINSKEEALRWMELFQEKTQTTYTVNGTFPENSQKLIFKKRFQCHHNTQPRSKKPHAKHTGCNAKVSITVKQPHMKRSKDEYLKEFPAKVDIRFNHNHQLATEDVLRFRRPTQSLKAIFSEYYRQGHTPSSALYLFTAQLRDQLGDENFEKVAADGSKFPTKKWCYDLYYKMGKVCRKEKQLDSNDIVIYNENSSQPLTILVDADDDNSDEKERVEAELNSVFGDLQRRLEEDPEGFKEPLQRFLDVFKQIGSDDELKATLLAFSESRQEPELIVSKSIDSDHVYTKLVKTDGDVKMEELMEDAPVFYVIENC